MILCGGEPTQHPQFPRLLDAAHQAGIQVSLASSGLFRANIRRHIRPPQVPEFVCHVDPSIIHRHPEWLPRLRENLAAAVTEGVRVWIRYTLTPQCGVPQRLFVLQLAKDLGIRKVHYGFAFQNVDGNNEAFRDSHSFDRILECFMDEAARTGVGLHLSKPLPLCGFRRSTLQRLLREGGLRATCPAHRRDFTQNLTINPDLSTQPCNALGRPGPRITDFADLAAAGAHYRGLLSQLYEHPWRSECSRCALHVRGVCQAVCLAEHQLVAETAPAPARAPASAAA
jgi:hypothetical protein